MRSRCECREGSCWPWWSERGVYTDLKQGRELPTLGAVGRIQAEVTLGGKTVSPSCPRNRQTSVALEQGGRGWGHKMDTEAGRPCCPVPLSVLMEMLCICAGCSNKSKFCSSDTPAAL